MSSLFKIGTINNISRVGLKRFPQNSYEIGALDNIFGEIAALEQHFKKRKVLSSTYQPPKPIARSMV